MQKFSSGIGINGAAIFRERDCFMGLQKSSFYGNEHIVTHFKK